MPKSQEVSFDVRWRNNKQQRASFSTGSPLVSDYHTVIDGTMTLRNARKKLIMRPMIHIFFDYPNRTSKLLTFCRPTGFSKLDLYGCIYKGFCKLYGDPYRYDIRHHCISDLFLEGCSIFKNGYIELAIGS